MFEEESINFNKPYMSGNELHYIADSVKKGKISGDGLYTKLCNEWFLDNINRKILLTTSCTSALEMMAMLLDIKEGDEVIMPSYTFVSSANAFVIRGAVPVFVDIRHDTLNINEKLVEQAITPKTKAVVAVHYAGVGCEMDTLSSICKKHGLYLLEDAAQGFGAEYKGKPLGTIGDLGTYSFHETKNVISGEGGCLIINNDKFQERSEIIREKGTNRSKFFRGEVDKYTWVDKGSSFLASDMIAAFLYAQVENAKEITEKRLDIWRKYHDFFEPYEQKQLIRRPVIDESCKHNAHMYYILFNELPERTRFIEYLKSKNINSVFHYIPLHSSPAGKKYGQVSGSMDVTNKVADTLLRLPLFYELNDNQQKRIFNAISDFFK